MQHNGYALKIHAPGQDDVHIDQLKMQMGSI